MPHQAGRCVAGAMLHAGSTEAEPARAASMLHMQHQHAEPARTALVADGRRQSYAAFSHLHFPWCAVEQHSAARICCQKRRRRQEIRSKGARGQTRLQVKEV